MSTNRIASLVSNQTAAAQSATTLISGQSSTGFTAQGNFLVCPVMLWQCIPPSKQAEMIELYQMAMRRTRELLQPAPSERLYAFSNN